MLTWIVEHPGTSAVIGLAVATLICRAAIALTYRVDTSEVEDPDSPWGIG